MAVPKNTRPGASRTVPIASLWMTGTHVVFDIGQETSSKAILGLLTGIPVMPPHPNRGAYNGLIEGLIARMNLATTGRE